MLHLLPVLLELMLPLRLTLDGFAGKDQVVVVGHLTMDHQQVLLDTYV